MSELNNNETVFLSTIILAVLVIIFITYFSKTPTLKLLLQSWLGRLLLILILLLISSYSKLAGLLSVLIIILLDISLGTDNYYLEGFKKINILELKENQKKNNSAISTKSPKAIEGNNFLDLQHNLRTGKSSNSIPISHNLLEPTEEVSPNEPDGNAFESINSII